MRNQEQSIKTGKIEGDSARQGVTKGADQLISSESKPIFSEQAIANLSKNDQALFQRFGYGGQEAIPFDCIHHAIEFQASQNPSALAAQHGDKSITYQELNTQANHLAQIMHQQGVHPGDHVALFVQRSIPMLVGILATLKCGAAYVPQHVGVAPEQQLRYVMEKSQAKIVLTLSEYKHLIPTSDQQPCLVIDQIMADQSSSSNIHHAPHIADNALGANNTCFVLFTSGTTGNPNGVQVTHKNVCNILLTEPGSMGMRPGLKVGQILNIAFDMAAWEILGCLSHGATLMIRGKDIAQTAEQVDVIIATPSILCSVDVNRCKQVKFVAVAGEPCPKPLADKWSARCTFYNSCGPTETTIVNTMQPYQYQSNRLTIGKPTPNNTVYVLDENLKPCKIGEAGEMWAGGYCVSAGYIGNDKLNSERYLPDPFLGEGHMMFRTRDLGRWTPEGELEHLGRTDDQVKVRGFRVELDSISTILENDPECVRAATLKLDNRTLVSFVSPLSTDTDRARESVAQALPYYCVPEFILALKSLPMTTRGKIDKRKLFEMAQEHQQYLKDMQDTERRDINADIVTPAQDRQNIMVAS